MCPDVVRRNHFNADTARASQISKSKIQPLEEFLAVVQATPVLAVDISDDEELAGGLSPTSCLFLGFGLDLTTTMREPRNTNYP